MRNTYVLKTDSVGYCLTIAEINEHLKESFVSFDLEPYLALLVKTVQIIGERKTKKDFLRKTYTGLFNNWEGYFYIRKSELSSITTIKYNGDTLEDTKYDILVRNEYSSVVFNDTMDYPTLETTPQPIEIEFIAGFEETPENLKLAMLQHLAFLWQSRGDCMNMASEKLESWIQNKMPATSLLIYSQNKIIEI